MRTLKKFNVNFKFLNKEAEAILYITAKQKAILIGLLVGGATISEDGRLKVTSSWRHHGYCLWLYEELKPFFNMKPTVTLREATNENSLVENLEAKQSLSTNPLKLYSGWTLVSNAVFQPLRSSFYLDTEATLVDPLQKNKKQYPSGLEELFVFELSLAVYSMDSLSSHRSRKTTSPNLTWPINHLTLLEQTTLQRILLENFEVKTTRYPVEALITQPATRLFVPTATIPYSKARDNLAILFEKTCDYLIESFTYRLPYPYHSKAPAIQDLIFKTTLPIRQLRVTNFTCRLYPLWCIQPTALLPSEENQINFPELSFFSFCLREKIISRTSIQELNLTDQTGENVVLQLWILFFHHDKMFACEQSTEMHKEKLRLKEHYRQEIIKEVIETPYAVALSIDKSSSTPEAPLTKRFFKEAFCQLIKRNQKDPILAQLRELPFFEASEPNSCSSLLSFSL